MCVQKTKNKIGGKRQSLKPHLTWEMIESSSVNVLIEVLRALSLTPRWNSFERRQSFTNWNLFMSGAFLSVQMERPSVLVNLSGVNVRKLNKSFVQSKSLMFRTGVCRAPVSRSWSAYV